MRIEHVDLDDDLVRDADELWPDSTWSEVIAHGLRLAVERRQAEDTAAAHSEDDQPHEDDVPEPADDLERRFAAAFDNRQGVTR